MVPLNRTECKAIRKSMLLVLLFNLFHIGCEGEDISPVQTPSGQAGVQLKVKNATPYFLKQLSIFSVEFGDLSSNSESQQYSYSFDSSGTDPVLIFGSKGVSFVKYINPHIKQSPTIVVIDSLNFQNAMIYLHME